jgi:AcrR family transcriptional regulator
LSVQQGRCPEENLVELAKIDAHPSNGERPRIRHTREERRAEIADATLRLMARYGLQGATVSRIADEIGVAPQSLYSHYESRQEMLVAAIDPLIEMTNEWLASSPEENTLERLRALGANHASFLADKLEGFVIPAYEFIVAPPDTGLPEIFGQRQLGQLQKIARIVDEGKRQGSIRADMDSMRAAWRLIVFAWAEDIAQMMGRHEFISEGVSTEILEVLLRDMAPSPAEAVPPDSSEPEQQTKSA